MKNPNPYSGEYYFNLCLALEADGQDEKAFDSSIRTLKAAAVGTGKALEEWKRLMRGKYESCLL